MRKRRRLTALALVLGIVLLDVGVYLMRPYPESPVTAANASRVQRSMSRDQFDAVLGPPATVDDVPGGGGQVVTWEGDGIAVIAGFGPDGRATHLLTSTGPPDGPFARLRCRLGL